MNINNNESEVSELQYQENETGPAEQNYMDKNKTAEIIMQFMNSYNSRKDDTLLADWLRNEFLNYRNVWRDEAEIDKAVKEVIETINGINSHMSSLEDYIKSGKSKECWLAEKIECGAKINNYHNVTEFSKIIDDSLNQTNLKFLDEGGSSTIDYSKTTEINNPAIPISWNDVSKIAITQNTSKRLMIQAALSSVIRNCGLLAINDDVLSRVHGNGASNKSLVEYFESPINSTENLTAGIQTSASGAILIATKTGYIPQLITESPSTISSIASMGLDKEKALYKFSRGDLSSIETLEHVTKINFAHFAALISEYFSVNLSLLGAKLGMVFGPLGSTIGGYVGHVVGRIASDKISNVIRKNIHKVVDVAKKYITKTSNIISHGKKLVARLEEFMR